MIAILRRARRTTSTNSSCATLGSRVLLPLLLALSLFGSAAQAKVEVTEPAGDALRAAEDATVAVALDDLSLRALAAEAQYDADGNKLEPAVANRLAEPSAELINAGTYVFAAATGVALEDMSSGTTLLVVAGLDDSASAIAPIGFDFWYDGVRQTLFSANANGLIRLGVANVSTGFSNNMTSTTDNPHIAPYWDDLWLGLNGKLHYKVVGSAPTRKLVVEWNNETIPRAAAATTGAGTFQAWLFESTGAIEFVYGSGMAVNAANSGYSVGLGTSATSFASVTTATNTVSYAVANNSQTDAIPSGTAYTFTPNAPNAPGALSFTAVGLSNMTLNWTDTNANEVGYAIYRSVDGVNYDFIRQTAVDAISSVETGLASNTTWSWRVVAVTEGGVSTVSAGSQATTTGTVSGTRSVGPTGTYASLGAAFTDVNTNGLAGNLLLELQAAYLSSVETFPLVISQGSPSNTISIRPETGATALSITSANTTATLDLNGTTNVTIDGRAGGAGASQLTIANSATAGVAVRLINGAARNTIQFASIQGVNTATTGGVVLFSTSTGGTGNNNNTIDNCDVRDGATTPVNGIASIGTASTSLLNTGNTISNTNIFNFYSAGSATTGILVTTNTNISNTGWTISNNRIFQTATRNYTTTNVHRGIFVVAGNAYTVSGNVVGFAAANGTGTYTMTSTAVATGFAGIQLQPGPVASSIQGNTVTAISLGTTTGALTGISLTSGAANIGTISPNTVGATTGTGAMAVTSTSGTTSFVVGMNVSGTGTATVNFSNNTIGSLSGTGSATVNTGINGVQLTGGALTVTNNLIGSASTANSIQVTTTGVSATSQQVIGMIVGVTAPITISGNTIANLTHAGTGTAHVTRGLQHQGIGAATIQLNSIHDISGAAANVTVAGGGTAVEGMLYTGNSPLGGSVDQNTIYTISATNAGAVSTTVAGVGYSNPANGTVTRNTIYDLRNASTGSTATAPPMAIGILIRAALGAGGTFANNMISLGDTQTTNTQFVGAMNSFVTNTVNFQYNSVQVGGTAGGGALPSYGFLRGDNGAASAITSVVNIKNNILNNTRTGGTGKHYAIGNVNTVPATGWGAGASDFNVLNSAVAGTVGIWGLATDEDFANWKTASLGDASSLSGATVTFVAPATADLHLNMGVTPTPLESGGTVIAGLTTDFDNQLRPGPAGSVNGGAIAPDIGADEFDGVPQDTTAPSISYSALANTTLTLNRTVSATITDSNGVAGGAVAPRIYYRKNAGSYFSNQCGAPAGNVYPCTIDYSLVGGAVTGDVIDYFVVAQDPSGNVGANPSGGFTATSVNSVTTPPTVPSTYTIIPGTTGTKTVCASGCDFATLTGAGGVFAGLNAGVATGNIVIEIGSDLVVGEDGSVALNPLAEEPAGSNFTVKIYPTGAARAITSTTAPTGGFIRLNGADRVTIDGSIGGTGTDRSLTITDTNTGTTSAVIQLQTNGADGAANNTLKNLIVVGNSNTTTFVGITSGGAGVASLGTDNDNTRIENCDIRKVQFGIALQGASAANKNTGNVITRNLLNSTAADSIAKGAILLSFDDGAQVTENTIGGIVSAASNDVFGISLGGLIGWTNTTAAGGSEVVNATVSRNSIGAVQQTNTFSATGILVTPTTTGTNLIANNFISGVIANGTAGDFGSGIFVIDSGTDSTTRLYANSVSMTGTLTLADQGQYALAVNGSNPQLDLRDNIFFNTQATGAANNSYAIGLGYAAFTNLTSNYNVLFVPAAGNFRVGRTVALAPAGGTDTTTLLDWQTATGKDANSLSADPLFTSASDLHLLGTSPAASAGTPLAAVTVDFDNDARDLTTPDIGADEIRRVNLSITKDDSAATEVPGTSVTYTIVAANAGPYDALGVTVADTFPAALLGCSTTCVASPGSSCTAVAVLGNLSDTANLLIGGSVTYTAVCNVATDATGTLVNTATVAAAGTNFDPNNSDNSATDTDTLTPEADLSITKTDGVTIATAGGSVTYTIVASNAGPSAAPGSNVTDNFPAACTLVSWTCLGSGSGTCTAGGSGNINDSVNLPVGGSVTYTAACSIDGSATGSLVNTATVATAGGITDPASGNNSATDTDTIAPQADLSITKTDGVTTASPGTNTTYTIVASNAGPSSAPTAAVIDVFPAACTSANWTCSGSGGGTCAVSGSGNINQSVNLPSGGSVTFIAVCAISPAATGTLSNTATIGVGVNDPNTANNSATDVDTLSNEIFVDGFETGDTSQWSATVPPIFEVYATFGVATGGSVAAFGYDFAAVQSGEALAPTAIAFVTDVTGKPLFLIGARRTDPNGQLELTLEIVGGGRSSWVPVGEVGQQVQLEWAAADQSNLGHVAVSLDGRLALWVEDYAGSATPAGVKLLRAPAPQAP